MVYSSYMGVSDPFKGSLKGIYKGLEFPKTRGTLLWGPYNKDPTI